MGQNKRAIIVFGGWDGHQPELVSARAEKLLLSHGFKVKLYDTLDVYEDSEELLKNDLIVSLWTQGMLTEAQEKGVTEAVAAGVGIAGCHGGMCDSFRHNTQWEFMTGGKWISHPGSSGITYEVNIKHSSSPLTEGISDFQVTSEHYFLHVDPAVEVLATTRFPNSGAIWYHSSNSKFDEPVCWTKRWGRGRVYYTSLGHIDEVFEIVPEAQELFLRGMLWASESEQDC